MTRLILAQELLRDGMSPAELFERHKVHIKPHNGKVSLIYDQIEASAADPVACQCRGMVLREGTWELLAYPFDRFFNHGQQEASELDLDSTVYWEKLDGTLIIAYWDDGRWHTATRSLTEAQLGQNGWTFRQLADRAAAEMGRGSVDDLLRDAPRDHTLMFELTAPDNQIVCEYPDRKLTLLGARRTHVDRVEACPEPFAELLGVPVPKSWEFSDLPQLVEVIRDWDPGKYEGVVACDRAFNRVKVKSPKYLAVHHATDSLGSSWRSCMAAVVSGAADDIEAHLPKFVVGRIEVCRDRLHKLIERTESDLRSLRDEPTMKDFALKATKCEFSSALFAVRRGNFDSVASFVQQFQPVKLVELCGLTDGVEDQR